MLSLSILSGRGSGSVRFIIHQFSALVDMQIAEVILCVCVFDRCGLNCSE